MSAPGNALIRRMRAEDGITLVELIVAMALTTVIVTAAVGFYISGAKATSLAENVDYATRQASNGMSEMSRMIRAATANPIANPTPGNPTTVPAVVSAATNSVTLFAYVNLTGSNESPVKVTFALDTTNGQLVETIYPATSTLPGSNGHWDFAAAYSSKRILCDSLPTGLQLFHYLPVGGPPEMTPPGTDPTGLANIRSIQITLTVQPGPSSTAVTLTNSVGMPNLGFTNPDSGS
ncbi:MAG TPA: prepilin-type N-terminal cleavage/methylation domain-containing protein [Microbacteriaceae bacterium]